MNLWVSDVDPGMERLTEAEFKAVASRFKIYFEEFGLPLPAFPGKFQSRFEKQVEAVLRCKPAVFSFIFGVPDKSILKECQRLNIKAVGSATTLEEAVLLQDAGVDAIIASGSEPGGHKPSFLRPAVESLTMLDDLVQELRTGIRIPFVAAGGIVDGKKINTLMNAGADGVQLGTAFLACDEPGATATHRTLLLSDAIHHTVLSSCWTGRLGSMIENRLTTELISDAEFLPFPIQNSLTKPLKEMAAATGVPNMANYWCGQCRQDASLEKKNATSLLNQLVKEMESGI
ncbi:MAG TPA: nitronate monooxygenase [Puia sp.]|nr:nitronate monooxygenase [Puia sp.]